MVLTRFLRLGGALGIAAACLTAPAAYAVPAPSSTCSGAKHASGTDINGDGYDDAVIGDPAATSGGKVATGAVRVLYGGPGGLGTGGATTITEDSPGVGPPGAPAAASGDGFGQAVTTAHINNDPCADVVIGAPWREVDGRADVGAAYVVYGSPQGLGKGRAGTQFTPDAWNGSNGTNAGAANSLFGYSVAAANASATEPSAIAIGAPYTDRPGKTDAGAAYVMTFGKDGTPQTHKRYFEDDPAGGAVASGLFGWSVALPSITGDPDRRDLAVGAPREPWNRTHSPGAVWLFGDVSASGPPATPSELGPAILGVPEGHADRIGFALAYAVSGKRYLAVAVPGAQVDGKNDAGGVALLRSDGRRYVLQELVTEGTHGSTTTPEQGDQYGRSVALGVDRTGVVRLGVGAPYETSRVRHDGAAQVVPITGGGKAVDLNQMLDGVPGSPGESAHLGLTVRFTGGSTLLIGIPDDREHPTGSVIEAPVKGPISQIVPPAGMNAMDFGMAL